MSYRKLLPSYDPGRSDLVRFYSELAVFIVEHVSLLGEDAGEQTDNCPAEEASIGGGVAAVEEGVLLLGVSMEVAKYPYLSLIFFLYSLHHTFNSTDLRMELRLRIDPLSVEIDASEGVPVVTADHSVRVHARDEHERIEATKILGLPGVTSDEFVNTLEHLAARRFTGVDS